MQESFTGCDRLSAAAGKAYDPAEVRIDPQIVAFACRPSRRFFAVLFFPGGFQVFPQEGKPLLAHFMNRIVRA